MRLMIAYFSSTLVCLVLSSKAALKHERGARERDGGGGEGKVSTRLTSATARYTGTKYRYNNAVQVRIPVRLSVPVHTSNLDYMSL